MKDKIDNLPGPNWIYGVAGLATALTAIITFYNQTGAPKVLTDRSMEVLAIQEDVVEHDLELRQVEIKVDENRMEQVQRYVRSDQRELYELEQRLEETPDNMDLVEQKIRLEEAIDELEAEKTKLRKKND